MDGESIRVTRSVVLPLREVVLRTSRSSGPGGQHAQKSETRVEAVFDVEASDALSPAQRLAGSLGDESWRVRKTVVTPDAAREAARRASVSGRCLLGPLAAYKYDTNTGTLAPRPELKACQYRPPGQAPTAAVRVAHVG